MCVGILCINNIYETNKIYEYSILIIYMDKYYKFINFFDLKTQYYKNLISIYIILC